MTSWLDDGQVDQLIALVGGHPYLIRTALYQLANGLNLDADTRPEPDALAVAAAWLKAEDADAVAFLLEAEVSPGLMTSLQRQEYQNALNVERTGQAALGAIAILPGAATLFRRTVLLDSPFYCRTCTEDADLTLSLSRKGRQLGLATSATAVTLVPRTFANLLRQRKRWMTGHLQCGLRHGLTKKAATLRFRWLTLPNVLLATQVVPLGVLVLIGVVAAGHTCLLHLGWIQVVAITTTILYLQRLSCWLMSRQDRPPRHSARSWGIGARSLGRGVRLSGLLHRSRERGAGMPPTRADGNSAAIGLVSGKDCEETIRICEQSTIAPKALYTRNKSN